jgi:hypothetical protein
MPFAIDTWLLPAIAAAASSYLVCILWEKIRQSSAPSGTQEALLAGLSFMMGGICAYYRYTIFATGPENNVIVMFVVGASTTYFWLLLRKYMPGFGKNGR